MLLCLSHNKLPPRGIIKFSELNWTETTTVFNIIKPHLTLHTGDRLVISSVQGFSSFMTGLNRGLEPLTSFWSGVKCSFSPFLRMTPCPTFSSLMATVATSITSSLLSYWRARMCTSCATLPTQPMRCSRQTRPSSRVWNTTGTRKGGSGRGWWLGRSCQGWNSLRCSAGLGQRRPLLKMPRQGSGGTGMFPLNKDILPETAFAPSKTTERVLPSTVPSPPTRPQSLPPLPTRPPSPLLTLTHSARQPSALPPASQTSVACRSVGTADVSRTVGPK